MTTSSLLRSALRAGPAAACAAVLALAAPGTATAAAAHPGPMHRQHFDASSAHRFLVGFYGHRGPNRLHRTRDVTPELRRAAARTRTFDLLLCAQNTPVDIRVGRVVDSSFDRGRAQITTHWAGGRTQFFTAWVAADRYGTLRLSDVSCR